MRAGQRELRHTAGRTFLGSLLGAVRLVHPFPVTVVVVTSVVLVVVAHHGSPGAGFLARAAGVVLLSQIAVGALNDFLDRDLDRIAQPDKPIPAGIVSDRVAVYMVVVGLGLMVPLALTFGPIAFLLTLLGTGAGLAYDAWLKPTVFSWLGYLVGFLALATWIWTVGAHFTPWIFVIYLGGPIVLLAAHLAQSFPDIETDRETDQNGLAVHLGARTTFWTIEGALLAADSGGTFVALLRRSPGGVALCALGLGLALAIIGLHRGAVVNRKERVSVFRLTALAIAAIVLGTLLAITTGG